MQHCYYLKSNLARQLRSTCQPALLPHEHQAAIYVWAAKSLHCLGQKMPIFNPHRSV
jgi:hypothetical protein